MLSGESDLYNHNGNLVSETIGNSCTLIHLTEGNYKWVLQKGNHKLLLITFRPQWFMKINEIYPEFDLLIDNYHSEKCPYHILPHCALADVLFKEFKHSAYGIDNVNYSRDNAVYA